MIHDDSVRHQIWNILQAEPPRTLHGQVIDTPWALFKAIDKNQNGQISAKELEIAVKRLGLGLNDAQVRSMLTDLDIDHDGVLSLSELTQWLSDPESGGSQIRGRISVR